MPIVNQWWRCYHGMPSDPKWAVVAARSGATRAEVVAIFTALCDYASQYTPRGCIDGFDAEVCATFLAVENAVVQNVLTALESKGITRDGSLTAWSKRNPQVEDRTAAQRQQKARLAKTGVTKKMSRPVTPESRPVTPMSHHVTTEERRGEERREEPPYPPAKTVTAVGGNGMAEAWPVDGFDGAAGFEEFWAAWPSRKQTRKPTCAPLYAGILIPLPPDEQVAMHRRIVEKLRPGGELRESRDWTRDGGKWLPSPEDWLRNRRWTEDWSDPVGDDTAAIIERLCNGQH